MLRRRLPLPRHATGSSWLQLVLGCSGYCHQHQRLTNMTTEPTLLTRDALIKDDLDFGKRVKRLWKRNGEDAQKLVKLARKQYSAVELNAKRTLRAMMDLGDTLEAISRYGHPGALGAALEQMGISHTSGGHYRKLARHRKQLEALPGIDLLGLNRARKLMKSWEAAGRDDLDDALDREDILAWDDDDGREHGPKGRTPGGKQRRLIERLGAQLVKVVLANRYEPSTREQLRDVIELLQVTETKVANDLDAAAEEQDDAS